MALKWRKSEAYQNRQKKSYSTFKTHFVAFEIILLSTFFVQTHFSYNKKI